MNAAMIREWELPGVPESIPTARSAVCEAVSPVTTGETVDVVALLVSEVVTNAFRHGDGPVRLRLAVDGDIHVQVADNGEGFVPAPRAPDSEPGGWGLYLVGMLSREWGTESDSETRVWFKVPL